MMKVVELIGELLADLCLFIHKHPFFAILITITLLVALGVTAEYLLLRATVVKVCPEVLMR